MVQVAEQFGNLRNTLGSILGIFALLRWVRSLFAKLTGQPLPSSSSSSTKDLTPSSFFRFQQQQGGHAHPSRPSPSKKPLLVFLLAVFGLPLIMSKLIRALSRQIPNPNTTLDPLQQPQSQQPNSTLDLAKLSFCRVIYDYTPSVSDSDELSVKKGDLVAVLSKTDPLGQPSDWWRCRTRDGRVGWLPSTYLRVIVREDDGATGKQSGKKADDDGGGGGGGAGKDKGDDISAEGFRRSGFYS